MRVSYTTCLNTIEKKKFKTRTDQIVGRDQYGTSDEQRRGELVMRFEREAVDVGLVGGRSPFEEVGDGRQQQVHGHRRVLLRPQTNRL